MVNSGTLSSVHSLFDIHNKWHLWVPTSVSSSESYNNVVDLIRDRSLPQLIGPKFACFINSNKHSKLWIRGEYYHTGEFVDTKMYFAKSGHNLKAIKKSTNHVNRVKGSHSSWVMSSRWFVQFWQGGWPNGNHTLPLCTPPKGHCCRTP